MKFYQLKPAITSFATILSVCAALGSASAPTSAEAQISYFGGGAGQAQSVFQEYGPRVPESILRGSDRLRNGIQLYSEEFKYAYPRPTIGKGRVKISNPWTGLFRPRCVGENC